MEYDARWCWAWPLHRSEQLQLLLQTKALLFTAWLHGVRVWHSGDWWCWHFGPLAAAKRHTFGIFWSLGCDLRSFWGSRLREVSHQCSTGNFETGPVRRSSKSPCNSAWFLHSAHWSQCGSAEESPTGTGKTLLQTQAADRGTIRGNYPLRHHNDSECSCDDQSIAK